MIGEEANPPDDNIRVAGEPYGVLPEDLYIPPDALRVFLEAFEGPLDLLLYLIRRQNLDVLDIPVLKITQQYMAYIEMMEEMAIELAGEYLLMAAMLAEIKSRMLLPRREEAEEDEGEDPRAELVRRLAEYEQFKEAADRLDGCPRMDRDIAPTSVEVTVPMLEKPTPNGDLHVLLDALHEVLARAELSSRHVIAHEPLSVREHMTRILEQLDRRRVAAFTALVTHSDGRAGVVVSFLAILELTREALIVVEQEAPYRKVMLRRREGA